MQSCPCNVYAIHNILLTLPEIKWGAGKKYLWLTHSKLLDFSWVGQRGGSMTTSFLLSFETIWTTKVQQKKFLLNIWVVHGQSAKCWVAMVPEGPTPVKVHSSNFVYIEHNKRTQRFWKTQNNSEWNWNLTTNFQVHAKEKKIPFPSFTPCVPKGKFVFHLPNPWS